MEKNGHTAVVCYYRFEKNFNNAQNSGNSSSSNQKKNSNPIAMIATLEYLHDSAWYLDSGASNHLTSDLANLTVKSDYGGNKLLPLVMEVNFLYIILVVHILKETLEILFLKVLCMFL